MSYKQPMTISDAVVLAEEFADLIPVDVIVAGSIRREEPIVGDIDVVSVGCFPLEVEGAELMSGGDRMRTYIYKGAQVNVMVSDEGAVGAMLLYATGSGKFGMSIRAQAKAKGFKLNRYGLHDRETDELVACGTEEEIFDAIGMPFFSPVERSGFGGSK
jgi:DNA polymerase (family 10)